MSKQKEPPSTSISPSKKRNTPLRSDVWLHYTRLDEDPKKSKCNYCGKILSCDTKSGTSGMRGHLIICKTYLIVKDSKCQQKLSTDGTGNLMPMMMTVTQEVFREATNEMLFIGELPLAFVEGMAYKHFCSRVLPSYSIHSRRTATRDIVGMYIKEKEILKKWFGVSKQRVSLTTDIWVASTTKASYMVITAHYIDINWNLKKKIIGFKHVIDHKGTTIASVLIDCLDDWGIEKVYAITVDNATANTSALKKFKDRMRLRESDVLILFGEFMHMHCAAHIMNLIVKDGLREISASVEAIRNVVTYLRSSTQRFNSFELRVEAGKITRGSLPLDITTRWNSTHLMLTRALKYKQAFERMRMEDKLYCDYFEEFEGSNKRVGPPVLNDWDEVQRLVKFLTIFRHATLTVSGSNYVNSPSCYNEIVTIQTNLITLSEKGSDELLKMKAMNMTDKFDKYWEGFENINKLLIVASVLDPTKKMLFASLCFDKLYGKESAQYGVLKDSQSMK